MILVKNKICQFCREKNVLLSIEPIKRFKKVHFPSEKSINEKHQYFESWFRFWLVLSFQHLTYVRRRWDFKYSKRIVIFVERLLPRTRHQQTCSYVWFECSG